jgi:uncharacterized protein with PIN domain
MMGDGSNSVSDFLSAPLLFKGDDFPHADVGKWH